MLKNFYFYVKKSKIMKLLFAIFITLQLSGISSVLIAMQHPYDYIGLVKSLFRRNPQQEDRKRQRDDAVDDAQVSAAKRERSDVPQKEAASESRDRKRKREREDDRDSSQVPDAKHARHPFPASIELTDGSLAQVKQHLANGPLNFPLSNIIEVYLQGTAYAHHAITTAAFIQGVAEHSNRFSNDLAKKWTRNAAIRIFNDNRRSFLELVVNACDAMLPAELSVGKFGMGFFSIFSFLTNSQTQGATVRLKTAYRQDDGNLYAYNMDFNGMPHGEEGEIGDIQITMSRIDPAELDNRPGTSIAIIPARGEFSDETLHAIENYVHYLDFYEKVQVDLVVNGAAVPVNAPVASSMTTLPRVQVSLNHDCLQVRDAGTGISLPVTFTKLLIPSSSSKSGGSFAQLRQQSLTNEAISCARLVADFKGTKNATGDLEQDKSFLFIEINGVIVIKKILKKVVKNADGHTLNLLLSMPQVTQLTLARDEIAFSTAKDKNFEINYLKKLISKTLETQLLGMQVTTDHLLLCTLYQGLAEWENQTAAGQIKGLFTTWFQKELQRILGENPYLIPTPSKFFNNIARLAQEVAGEDGSMSAKLIPLNKKLIFHDFSRLTNYLKRIFLNRTQHETDPLTQVIQQKALEGKLIAGMHVFFVNENCLPTTSQGRPIITTFGLKGALFVPQGMLHHCMRQVTPTTPLATTMQELFSFIQSHLPELDVTAFRENESVLEQVPLKIIAKTNAPQPSMGLFRYCRNACLFKKEDSALLQEFFQKHYAFFDQNLFCNPWFPCLKSYDCFETEFKESIKAMYRETKSRLGNINDWHQAMRRYFGIDEYRFRSGSFIGERYDEAYFVKNDGKSYLRFTHQLRDYCRNDDKREQLQRYCDAFFHAPDERSLNIALDKWLSSNLIEIPVWQLANNMFGYLIGQYNVFEQVSVIPFSKVQCIGNILINDRLIFPLFHQEKGNKLAQLEELFFTLIADQKRVKIRDGRDLLPKNTCCIEFPHLTEGMLQKEIPVDELVWGAAMSQTLGYSIEGLSVQHVLAQLIMMQTTFNASPNSAVQPHHKQLFAELKNALMGMYHRYLTIPDNEFKRVYGNVSKASVQNKYFDCDCTSQEAGTLLCTLSTQQPSLLEKLLWLQKIDFMFQTRTDLRAQDLSHYNFYLPSILKDTPISVLSLLKKELNRCSRGNDTAISQEIINVVLEEAKTPQELLFICFLFLQVFYEEGFSSRLSIAEEIVKLMKVDALSARKFSASLRGLQSDFKVVGKGMIRFIIHHFILEKIDQIRITSFYESNRTSREFFCFRLKGEPATKVIYEALKKFNTQQGNFNEVPQLSPAVQQSISTASVFTLKQLIQAQTAQSGFIELLMNGDLGQALPIIQAQSPQLAVSKITQNVEAGTEKDPLVGTLIETLQNSVDAIKQYAENLGQDASYQRAFEERQRMCQTSQAAAFDQLTSIRYKLECTAGSTPENKRVKLTLRDYVGMPTLKTLLTNFIIPDYSEKSRALGNIGDMGNGSFIMYQNADFVSVVTRSITHPEKVYLLHITPKRNADSSLVEDLELRVVDVSDHKEFKTFFGTSITLVLRERSAVLVQMDLLHAQDFLLSSLSATHVSVTNPFNGRSQKIALLLEKADKADELLTKDDMADEKSFLYEHKVDGQVCYRFYRRANPLLPSYVTTGGIPFRFLASLAKQMKLLPEKMLIALSNGYVCDLALGTYEPVQSRAQLQMQPALLKELKRALLEGYYRDGLQRGADDTDTSFLNNNFLHFASSINDFHQLRLSVADYEYVNQLVEQSIEGVVSTEKPLLLNDFFTYYKPLSMHKSFFEHMNDAFDRTLVPALTAKCGEITGRANEALIAFVKARESEIRSKHRDSWYVDSLFNDANRLLQSFEQEWFTVREALFDEYKRINKDALQLFFPVVSSWFEKKIKTMDLQSKDIKIIIKELLNITDIKTSQECFEHARGEEAYKKLSPRYKGPKKNQSDELHVNLEQSLGKNLDIMLQHFCNCYFIERGLSASPVSGACFYYKSDQTKGFFTPKTKAMRINLSFLDITSQIELLSALLKGSDTILSCKGYLDLYAPKIGCTPTLIHELEHARRDSAHGSGDGAHADGFNADGERASFDSCANSFACQALRNGLLNKWQEAVRRAVLDDEKERIIKLGSDLDLLREVEKASKEFLCKKIGIIQ